MSTRRKFLHTSILSAAIGMAGLQKGFRCPVKSGKEENLYWAESIY